MSDYDIIIYTIVKGEYIMKRIGKKGRFVLLLVLQILVVLTMVAEIFNRNFYNVFLCANFGFIQHSEICRLKIEHKITDNA